MTHTCTWRRKDDDCMAVATKLQTDRDGKVWANLCDEHSALIDKAIDESDVKKMLAYWVAASGGPKKMTERM